MIETALQPILRDSLAKTLETMFFAMPDEVSESAGRPAGDLFAVHLGFQGTPPGSFGLLVPEAVARALTANFLGCEDEASLKAEQVSGVVAELANIVCGAILTEIESDANFDLDAPRTSFVRAEEPAPHFFSTCSCACRFEFAEGALVAFLSFQEMA